MREKYGAIIERDSFISSRECPEAELSTFETFSVAEKISRKSDPPFLADRPEMAHKNYCALLHVAKIHTLWGSLCRRLHDIFTGESLPVKYFVLVID
jgi:hypothetical protein